MGTQHGPANNMNFALNWKWIAGGIGILTLGALLWYGLQPRAELVSTETPSVDFGTSEERPGETGTGGGEGIPNEILEPSEITPEQKIFKIADGPVAGATLIQTTRPTTTLARYIKADSGRVFDLPLDVPGALPRAVSNTTIPGIVRAEWLPDGEGVVAQYASGDIRKTLYVKLLSATTTLASSANPQPLKIQYLPDNIIDYAVSPTSARAVYLTQAQNGVDGYLIAFDGSAASKLFSLPLSQVDISWPAANTLYIQSRTMNNSLGVAFSVNVQNGLVSTLFFAQGLNGIADPYFSSIIYQTTLRSEERAVFTRNLARGTEARLSFTPIPEKCTWSKSATSTLYCATPLTYTPPQFLDLWHLGVTNTTDSLVSYDITGGTSDIKTTPGTDGGIPSDMAELSLSPNEKYLSFIRRGDRGVWGIRLEP